VVGGSISSFLCCSGSIEICKIQDVIATSTLVPTHPSQSLQLFGLLMLEIALMLAALFRELLTHEFCYRVSGRSICHV